MGVKQGVNLGGSWVWVGASPKVFGTFYSIPKLDWGYPYGGRVLVGFGGYKAITPNGVAKSFPVP